jgi:hypothetical protein
LEAFVFELFVLALGLWIATRCDFDRIGIWSHPLIQFFPLSLSGSYLSVRAVYPCRCFIYLGAGISLKRLAHLAPTELLLCSAMVFPLPSAEWLL